LIKMKTNATNQLLCGLLLACLAPLLHADISQAETTRWTTEGTKLFLSTDGGEPQEHFLRGVCYSPTPIGGATFAPSVGDWFVWNFAGIWGEVDLPAMRDAKINHLRTYFWWVVPPPGDINTWRQEFQRLEAVDRERMAQGLPRVYDHTQFLDQCHELGISVLIGLAINGGELFEGDKRDEYFQFFKFNAEKIAERYGNHPAVVGLCVGNEQNQPHRISNPEFLGKLAEIGKAFKQKAPDKLLMIAFQNDAALFTVDVGGSSFPEVFARTFDIWGLNIYAGMDSTLALYKQHVASRPWARPLIVSEWAANVGAVKPGTGKFGPPLGNAQPMERENFDSAIAEMRQKWNWMMANREFVVGSQYFSWVDEWWKNFTDPNYVYYTDTDVANVDLSVGNLRRVALPEYEWVRQNPHDPNSWRKWRVEDDQGRWRALDGKMIFPTFVYRQEASHDPEYPEEMWGLNRISPNNRDPENPAERFPPFNEYGYMYYVDHRHPRPTLDYLTELHRAIVEE